MNISVVDPPAVRYVLVVCASPDDMVFALGGVIGAFADAGTSVQVVLLTGGRLGSAATGFQVGAVADRLGVCEVELLGHTLPELRDAGVDGLAREVAAMAGRADAVLAVDARGERRRSARAVAFQTAVRVATLIGAPMYGWSAMPPRPRLIDDSTIAVDVDRTRQQAAIGGLVGISVGGVAGRRWPGSPQEYLTLCFTGTPSSVGRAGVPGTW